MAPTNNGTTISLYIKQLIENKSVDYGIDKVYYGDQRILADGVVVCVEPSTKTSEPYSTGQRMEHNFQTSIIIYVSGGYGIENVQETADLLLESIEDLLNKDASSASLGLGGTQLGDNITSGWCTSSQNGYRVPTSQTTRANRLIFSSKSRTSLLGT